MPVLRYTACELYPAMWLDDEEPNSTLEVSADFKARAERVLSEYMEVRALLQLAEIWPRRHTLRYLAREYIAEARDERARRAQGGTYDEARKRG